MKMDSRVRILLWYQSKNLQCFIYLFIFIGTEKKEKIYNFKLSGAIPATAAKSLKENILFEPEMEKEPNKGRFGYA